MFHGERVLWIEKLRVTACLAVVILHVGSAHFDAVSVDTFEWQAVNFWCSVTRFAVPVFFMISGMLYLNPGKEISLSRLYKKNIGKLFLTYWFWMLFYGFWNVFVYWGTRGTFTVLIKEIIKTGLLSPPAHMWYLPALIGILMICPILRLLTKKEESQLLKYTIAVCLVFGILKNTVQLFEIPHKEMVSVVLNSVSPEMAAGWIGIFLTGFYLYQYGVSQKGRYALYLMGILSVAVAVLLNAAYAWQTGTADNRFCNNLTLFPTLYAFAVFVFFMKQQKEKTEYLKHLTLNISQCTLGIYLLHPCWIDIFEKAGITGISGNPWIQIPVLGAVIFLGSWIIVLILKRIPVLGKWIV